MQVKNDREVARRRDKLAARAEYLTTEARSLGAAMDAGEGDEAALEAVLSELEAVNETLEQFNAN